MYKTPTRIASEYAQTVKRAREAAEVLGHEPKRFKKMSDGHYQTGCYQCLVFVDLHLTPDKVWHSSGEMLAAPCRGRMSR